MSIDNPNSPPDIPDPPEPPDPPDVPTPVIPDPPEMPDPPDIPPPDIPDSPNIPDSPDIPELPDLTDIDQPSPGAADAASPESGNTRADAREALEDGIGTPDTPADHDLVPPAEHADSAPPGERQNHVDEQAFVMADDDPSRTGIPNGDPKDSQDGGQEGEEVREEMPGRETVTIARDGEVDDEAQQPEGGSAAVTGEEDDEKYKNRMHEALERMDVVDPQTAVATSGSDRKEPTTHDQESASTGPPGESQNDAEGKAAAMTADDPPETGNPTDDPKDSLVTVWLNSDGEVVEGDHMPKDLTANIAVTPPGSNLWRLEQEGHADSSNIADLG